MWSCIRRVIICANLSTDDSILAEFSLLLTASSGPNDDSATGSLTELFAVVTVVGPIEIWGADDCDINKASVFLRT